MQAMYRDGLKHHLHCSISSRKRIVVHLFWLQRPAVGYLGHSLQPSWKEEHIPGSPTCDLECGGLPRAERQIHTGSQGPRSPLSGDLPAGQVSRHQGGGAGRVDTHAGRLQAESVRDAASCNAGGAPCSPKIHHWTGMLQ